MTRFTYHSVVEFARRGSLYPEMEDAFAHVVEQHFEIHLERENLRLDGPLGVVVYEGLACAWGPVVEVSR